MMAVVGAIMGCQEGNFRVSPEGTGSQHGVTDLVTDNGPPTHALAAAAHRASDQNCFPRHIREGALGLSPERDGLILRQMPHAGLVLTQPPGHKPGVVNDGR